MKQAPRMKFSLTEPQTAFLRAEAARLGLTISELLRRIIDRHREQRETKAA